MKDFGPIVPIVTPCRRSGELDLDSFRSVVQEMIQAGCKAIFVLGSTGRGPWFNREDRVRLCRDASDQVRGKLPLIAGVMASGVPGMLENTHLMADSGAQIAVATVPGYFKYSPPEIESIYLKFADQSPLPVIVYDIPEFTNTKFDQGMIVRLARHGNIIGLKDSSADFERFGELIESLQEFPDFYLFQGKENLIADSLRLGASGFVVSMIHLDPKPFIGMYRAVQQGEYGWASAIQIEINQAMRLVRASIESRPESSTLFHMLNHALQLRGVCANILLEHDGEAPAWLIENAGQAIHLCNRAAQIAR